ncbi:MAG TPA: translation initiation factor IF-3 [Terriglobales bacterium]|nr:translation initiation factor IF-3 [Terriglobales bacterium]
MADFRPRRIPEPRTRTNERIRAREIRVIDENGQQLGILPPQEALAIARQKGLDLVEVSATAQPPVCRIMDFGKYQYQMEKKAREARKHQKNIVIKEVKFRPNTDEHDYEFKKNNVLRFLGDGDKVKAIVQFRGREITHKEIGMQLLTRLLGDVEPKANVEFHPRMEGNVLTAILAPKK